jgi:hypothetical protein
MHDDVPFFANDLSTPQIDVAPDLSRRTPVQVPEVPVYTALPLLRGRRGEVLPLPPPLPD